MAKKKRSKILKAKKRAERRYRSRGPSRLDMRKGGRVSLQYGGSPPMYTPVDYGDYTKRPDETDEEYQQRLNDLINKSKESESSSDSDTTTETGWWTDLGYASKEDAMAATHADGFPLYNEDGSLKERTENFSTVSKDGNWEYENDPSGTLTGNQKPTSEYLAEQKKAGYDWDTEANNWIPITEEARDATIYQATEAARVRRPERLAEAEVSLEAAKKGIVDDTLKIKDPLEVGGFKKNPDGTIQMYPAGHDKAGQPIPVVEDLTTDQFEKTNIIKAGYIKNADGTLKLNEAGEPITISADTVTDPTAATAGTASSASIAADTKTKASGHKTYTADQLQTTQPTISEAIGSLDDGSLAKAVGVQNVGLITETAVEVPAGALVDRVTGTLTEDSYATAAKVTGTSLPRITRAKTQLRNAGLTEAQISAIGNNPELLEAELENLTEEERGIIAGLPKEALVTTQLDALLTGIEDGEIPVFARPAINAIEQMLAQRGLDASTIGRDALVNGLIQSAIPLAQANAEALQASIGQQKSIDASIALKEAEFRQDAAMQKAQAVFSLDMAQFDEARTREIANSKFFQTIGLTEASYDQERYVQDAVLLSQENLAQADIDQKRAIQHAQAFLSMDMANLTNEQAARILEANLEQERLISNQAATNASRQFNATSKSQTDQFMASLESEISRFNSNQTNLQNQFNATQTNLVDAQNADRTADINKFNAQLSTQIQEFNSQQEFDRNQWNLANAAAVKQSNTAWRRQLNVANTAAQNAVNMQNAQNAFNMSAQAQAFAWQEIRDQADYDFRSFENERTRVSQLVSTAISSDPERYGYLSDNVSKLVNTLIS